MENVHSGFAAAALLAAAFAAVGGAEGAESYIPLEYIQGSGNGTAAPGAYILADDIFINPQTDRIVTTFSVGSESESSLYYGYAIWSARASVASRSYSLFWNGSGYFYRFMFQTSCDSRSQYQTEGPDYKDARVTVTAEGNSWRIVDEHGNENVWSWPSDGIDPSFTRTGGPLVLFAAGNGTSVTACYSPHKLYSFQVFTRSGDEYTLAHDLVPSLRTSDAAPGLFDSVTGSFYANAGTGGFVYPRPSVVYVAAGETRTTAFADRRGFFKTGPGTLVLTNATSAFSGTFTVCSGKVVLKGGAIPLARHFRRKEDLSLPSGYTMLDRLLLAGNAQDSYVDTGFAPASGTFGFLFDYSIDTAIVDGGGGRLMGSATKDAVETWIWQGLILSPYVAAGQISTRSGLFSFGANDPQNPEKLYVNVSLPSAADGGQVAFERMRFSVVYGSAELSRGWRMEMSTENVSGFNGNVYLGNYNASPMSAAATPTSIYRFKIFKGYELLHDFVPVQDPSGALGLYDTYGSLGFRAAKDQQYASSGGAYAGSDSEWLEIGHPFGSVYYVR